MTRFVAAILSAAVLQAAAAPPLIGQNKEKVIIDPKEVDSIVIQAEKRFPDGPFNIKLGSAEQMAPVLDWLRAIDWDPNKAGDARVINVVLLAVIELYREGDKQPRQFVVSDGLIIFGDRWWKADAGKLAEAIEKIRKLKKKEK